MRIGTFKESYVADAALFDSRTQHAWLAVAAVLLLVFPFVASDYWLYMACLVAINVASATGLNILTGYTGLVSLGQAAFMGLGAYTVAILQTRYGTPFLFNLLAGGVVVAVHRNGFHPQALQRNQHLLAQLSGPQQHDAGGRGRQWGPQRNGLESGGHGAIPVRQKWKGVMGWIVAWAVNAAMMSALSFASSSHVVDPWPHWRDRRPP